MLDDSERLFSHITLDETKHNLHIDNSETDDDVKISACIESALTAAQSYCDHYFAHTELSYVGFNFDNTSYKMRVSPFESLISFESSDDGTTWTDVTSIITVEKRDTDFTFHFEGGLTSDYIRFTIRVGYAPDKLPEDAKAGLIIKASDIFDTERSSYIQKVVNAKTFETFMGAYFNTRW